MTEKKTVDYLGAWISIGLITAIAVVLALLFLSSKAEAHRGEVTKTLSIFNAGGKRILGDTSNRVSALVWEVPTSAFEHVNRPVEFLLQWPRLPSIADVQIKIAKEKLAEYVARWAEEKEEKRKALELKYDWEAFQKALGLCLVLSGAFLAFIYGRPSKTFKSPSDKGEITG